MQIQISLLLQKPTDLVLHYLQWQDLSGFSWTRVKSSSSLANTEIQQIKVYLIITIFTQHHQPQWTGCYSRWAHQVKKCLQIYAKWPDSECKYHIWLCSLFIHSVISNDSVSRQWRLGSDRADAQADPDLHCQHMTEDTCTFLHDTAHKYVL